MGTGMEETYQLTSALKHLPFGKQVALITDARFSGVSTGACIGHVGPEALAGGPIGRVRDGDRIRIRIDCRQPRGTLDLVGDADGHRTPDAPGPNRPSYRLYHPGLAPHEKLPGRHPPLGRAGQGQRRNLGRVRVRRRLDRRGLGTPVALRRAPRGLSGRASCAAWP
jgi:hypothetical protein